MVTVAEGHELAGRYVVEQQLGAGGSGQVWRAHDTVLERTVAVKVVPNGTAAALAREARATAGIGVPNVIGIYDVGEQDGVHFLVMEYVDGVDLSTLLHMTGPLEPELAVLLGRDIARGVAAVHSAGLVHRDVTPANVLVTVEGEVKLTDLGIARRSDAAATRQLTRPDTVVGTVDYLAPEQVEGHEVTAASDVYAVGLLLHTACTGRAPFGDGPVSERVARRLTGGPAQLGDEVGALAEVIAAAVQRDPADRPKDGRALRDALTPLVPDDAQPLRRRLADRVARAAGVGPHARADTTLAVEGLAAPIHRRSPDDGGRATPPPTQQFSPDDGGRATPPPTQQFSPDDGGRTTPPPTQESSPDDDRSPLALLLRPTVAAVVGVVLVVGAVSAIIASNGSDGSNGGDNSNEGQLQPLAVAAVDDHDPLGGGGEHGDQIGRIADGDPGTSWNTEGYDGRPDLGGLKDGVGFLVDLGSVTDVAAVELDLVLDGVDLAVTVSEDRPDGDPTTEATVLGTVEGAGGTVRVEGEAIAGRWVAVWFTSLAPDGGRYRAEVAEVRVLGP